MNNQKCGGNKTPKAENDQVENENENENEKEERKTYDRKKNGTGSDFGWQQ